MRPSKIGAANVSQQKQAVSAAVASPSSFQECVLNISGEIDSLCTCLGHLSKIRGQVRSVWAYAGKPFDTASNIGLTPLLVEAVQKSSCSAKGLGPESTRSSHKLGPVKLVSNKATLQVIVE